MESLSREENLFLMNPTLYYKDFFLTVGVATEKGNENSFTPVVGITRTDRTRPMAILLSTDGFPSKAQASFAAFESGVSWINRTLPQLCKVEKQREPENTYAHPVLKAKILVRELDALHSTARFLMNYSMVLQSQSQKLSADLHRGSF